MKWIVRILAALALVAVVAIGLLYATGRGEMISLAYAFLFGAPALPFDPDEAIDPPDYADTKNWAALPDMTDLADMIPATLDDQDIQGTAPVDVFFIHPTGFLNGSSWVSTMDPASATEENTKWMMANQASAFNGCCNVYAPRYREASIFAYIKGDEIREQILAFAYPDVERAFRYYLEHFNNGRPFIIASHSQGTHHGASLLKDVIDGSPLVDQMVAAYLIGGGLTTAQFDEMADIKLCDSATDLHCAVHWDTYSDASIDNPMPDRLGNACVNPLNWEIDGGLAPKSQHAGGVVASGVFQIALSGSDAATGVDFRPLAAPIRNLVAAQCSNGVLYASDQSATPFGNGAMSLGDGNYHGLNYPLFHMDIRQNASLKVATYLSNGR